jgi:hypothetical protein
MQSWTFPARTPEAIGAVLRALGKHRYVKEVDLRLHWSVDAALTDRADSPGFGEAARALAGRVARDSELDLASRDPTLWRSASVDEVIAVLKAFWAGDSGSQRATAKLASELTRAGLGLPDHEPFDGDVECPEHPQLVLLSWTLLPVCELDAERHAGALTAMEEAGEEVDVSVPIDHEGPDLGWPELSRGASGGELIEDFFVWADGPESYSDYVFRGVTRAAKLT